MRAGPWVALFVIEMGEKNGAAEMTGAKKQQ